MKRFVLVFCALILSLQAFAQSGKVSFSLIDSQTKEGVMGAVIELYSKAAPDKKRYYTSGANGYVSIPSLAYGSYTMTASFIGYKDAVKEFRLSGATLSLGKIEMSEDATKIETVVKEVKSLRASQNGDTLSYNAGAFKVTTDADVEGLLKKMPGITINNGTVEAQGETIQKVFVDGKEFFGEDVSTAIKSLPAEAVDRVEVFNKLSDQAEFSGMDDGEGYKAINIVTKSNMRQGQFGKMYAGYGYEPDSDDKKLEGHKYVVGGNVNFFQGDARVSLIGLFNNINQQNFSFEDILGVSGANKMGGGGGGRGMRHSVGQYMVQPQSGVALVNSLGLNYSDEWGIKNNVKFQGSLFFNNTSTENNPITQKWYEAPNPLGYMYESGHTTTTNNNLRLNARLDWKISRNVSLMSRTSLSYQGNNPYSFSQGYTDGITDVEENEGAENDDRQALFYTEDKSENIYHGLRFNEFLQLRTKLGKPGRTMTVGGRFSYQNNHRNRYTSSNDAPGVTYGDGRYDQYYNDYIASGKWGDMATSSIFYDPVFQNIKTPTESYDSNIRVQYNEPLGLNTSLSFQYRVSYEREEKEQEALYADSYRGAPSSINEAMSINSNTGFWTHRVGPGFRYAKDRRTVIFNVNYQYSQLNALLKSGSQSDRISNPYHDFSYFAMANVAVNKENTFRIFLRSWTDCPSVTQLQSIFDVSNPQYISVGNKELNRAISHNFNIYYNHSNLEKGITFMWMAWAQMQQDYISSSTLNNNRGWELPDKFGDIDVPKREDGTSYAPQRITSYENLDGYWNVRTHVSLGVPLSFMKYNLNIRGGVIYSRIPSAVYLTADSNDVLKNVANHNFQTNFANNIGYDAGVTIGSNISENLDFTLSWNGTYSQAWNTLGSKAKNDYFYHSANGSLKWIFWKGFTLTAAVSYVQYLGFTDKYNEDYVLCNVYLGYKLFKNKRGEIQVGVNDVFDQNTSFVRSTGSGYTQNAWNSTIGRYFSVQFVYNLRNFGKRGSKQMSDYDYKESKSSVGIGRTSGGPMGWGPRR
ncbi:MAG: outer membrane beta-barrel protein [Alistipes sp.]|nr:outer membrane beta-barrel protein [Alistipes sp.]